MFKIALRNVFRNRRRSVLSFTIIGLGGAMLFLVNGFVADSLTSMEEGFAGGYGYLQIADPGFWDRNEEPAEYLLLPDRVNAIERILSEQGDVVSWTSQLDYTGLVGNADKTAMVLGTGTEVENDTTDPIDPLLVSGGPVPTGDSREILLGRLLAERLDVGPGDRINIAGFTVTESLNAMTVGVAGTFRFFNVTMEEQMTYIPLSLAQALLRTDGVDKVIVRLTGLGAVDSAAVAIQSALDTAGIGVQVKTWQEIAPYYNELKTFYDALQGLSTMGVFILAFFGIMQVLTMSFMERTREVGTIRAVGTKRWQVFNGFLLEAALLGVLGGILAIAVGFGLGAAVNAAHLGWMYPGATEPEPVGIQLALGNAIVPFLVAVLSAVLSAIYPALHAARTNVVKALHYV